LSFKAASQTEMAMVEELRRADDMLTGEQ
jgi:hypothetical protein